MHRKFSLPALALIFLAMLASYTFCQRPVPVNQNLLLQLVTGTLDYAHYSPPRLDDEFSANLFKTHLKAMDYGKQFFTAEDLSKFEPFKNQLDDEIKAGRFDFYQQVLTTYQTRLKEIEGFYKEILAQPMDLTSQEVLETDAEKTDFPKDDQALREAWRKTLTYQVMTRVYESLSAQKTEKADTSATVKTLAGMESEARTKVRDLYADFFTRLEQRDETDYMALYVNSITSVFDPHTQYLPPRDKENFDISMSGQFEGIGATLQESEGYIKVVDLVPGSPSWLQGKIKVNDLIMKVRQPEEAEPMDVYGMRIDDVVKKIRGKKGTSVILSIKHVDGSIEEITLVRDVIIMEETYAKSAILRDSLKGQKVGYINLPKFYVDFNHTETGRSCADDVAAEIEKLKAEQVSGIILDLRNNGGGSLPDAVKMAGLFIPKGPVVQVSQRNGRKQVLADTDAEVQYDGNLIVMVNPLSASASEILAAAMQDYKRAIIMGSSTTFGKGTVQTVVDLNDLLREASQDKEKVGSMLITIQKFFRINGGSTQLKGVRPDIVMPDVYSEMQIGERREDFPLPWTEIDPAPYTLYDKNSSFASAIEQSKARIDTSSKFSALSDQMSLLKQQREDSKVPLNLDLYTSRDQERKEANKKINEMNLRKTSLQASILSEDAAKVGSDTVKISRNATWISSLEKDVYLEEAVKVLETL